jgi:hypothetical protein
VYLNGIKNVYEYTNNDYGWHYNNNNDCNNNKDSHRDNNGGNNKIIMILGTVLPPPYPLNPPNGQKEPTFICILTYLYVFVNHILSHHRNDWNDNNNSGNKMIIVKIITVIMIMIIK